jgi:hypothetical protein
MATEIKSKLENADKGFSYTVTPEQLEAYQKWTIEERLRWIWETNVFLSKVQTPEERERMLHIKFKRNK